MIKFWVMPGVIASSLLASFSVWALRDGDYNWLAVLIGLSVFNGLVAILIMIDEMKED